MKRGLVVNLVAAIGHPPLVLWLAHGAGTTVSVVLVYALVLAGVLLSAEAGWLFAGVIASLLAVATTISGVDDDAARARGVHASCVVVGVEERDETRSHTGSDGSVSISTTTVHDHRLRCDGVPVDLLSWPSRLAEPGQRLEIVHDPLRPGEPAPASAVRNRGGSHGVALIATVLAVVFRVGGVLRHRRAELS
ncbi:DUF3592 domain-containing protein [Allokutzneria sp. NRRL B-24872]|uniref:DUF3592 domain-containing protein n=1 Tax=Allokutzneria sp. NRRL B-24872 TaxID=1137961 RepID=UPI000A3A1FFA|nr:DUF3592 domain-containing protein [Allokutzneria sp. NRRL B-24872]